MPAHVRLAVISDIHLGHLPPTYGMVFPDEAGRLLDTAVTEINGQADVDGVLVLGDLVDNGQPAELDDVAGRLARLHVPWYAIPGNHDVAFPPNPALLDRRRFYEQLARLGDQGASYADAAQTGGWTAVLKPGVRLIGLDSNVPGDWNGEVDAALQAWLRRTLDTAPEPCVIVAVHHALHQVFTGWQAPDFMGHDWGKFFCGNGPDVRALLDGYPQVRLVLTGHAHVTRVDPDGSRLLIGAPALGIYPMAYRVISLAETEDGWDITWRTQPVADADLHERACQRLEASDFARCYDPADPSHSSRLTAGRPQDQQGTAHLAAPDGR
ncbi:MAG TPA: metallophosphoesterase [Chloroflexia bacterium]|nr:metallophosphoesterase [Chloroflexia bacterium]